MIRIPAQRVELRRGSRPWVEVTPALAGAHGEPGFVEPVRELESESGRPLGDQVSCRLLLDLLDEAGRTILHSAQDARLELRVFYGEAAEGRRPDVLVFSGQVVEAARLTTSRAGDTLELTALDRLAGARETPPPTVLVGEGLFHYGELVAGLAEAAGLTTARVLPPTLAADRAVFSHHPPPETTVDAGPRALTWWPTGRLLLCGVDDRILGYNPREGRYSTLALPPRRPRGPRCVIDHLWVEGDRVLGVATAVDGPEAWFIEAELGPGADLRPVRYTRGRPFRRARHWRLHAREGWWWSFTAGVGVRGWAVGLAGPDNDRIPVREPYLATWYSQPGGTTYSWSLGVRSWRLRHLDGPAHFGQNVPGLFGRNLYLSEESLIEAEYDGSGLRKAPVVCCRQSGPSAYYVTRRTFGRGGRALRNLGNFSPHAEPVGELPLSLEPGWYSFLSHGEPKSPSTRPEGAEAVDGFSLVFSRRAEPLVIVCGALLSVEDGVNVELFDEELGPLAIESADEFERVVARSDVGGDSTVVSGWPRRTFDIHLAPRAEDEIIVAFARDVGLRGAYGREEPLVKLYLGRVRRSGDRWCYEEIDSLGGWSAREGRESHSHYRPTGLAVVDGRIYVGVREERQLFHEPGCNVAYAFTRWSYDGDKRVIGGGPEVSGEAVVLLDGHHEADFAVGDRIRLWPERELDYAPLPRRISEVGYDNAFGVFHTRLTLSVPLDVTRGPGSGLEERRLIAGTLNSFGDEEYRRDLAGEFPWVPPRLQLEGVREDRHRLYCHHRGSWSVVDEARERETVSGLVDDDGLLTLPRRGIESESVSARHGGEILRPALDARHRLMSGETRLRFPRRYSGVEVETTFDYWTASAFRRLCAVEGRLYYLRGGELRCLEKDARSLGMVQHSAEGSSTPLVVVSAPRTRIYGFVEGGDGSLFQYAHGLSGFLADRRDWAGRDVPGCLAEVALALDCRLWVDAGGGLHFVPRGHRGRVRRFPAEMVIDYRDCGVIARPPGRTIIRWPGGEEAAGTARRSPVVISTEAVGKEIQKNPGDEIHLVETLTSAGWAGALAEGLLERRRLVNRQAELTLEGIHLDLEPLDVVVIEPWNGPTGGRPGGVVVRLEPDCLGGNTRITLEELH